MLLKLNNIYKSVSQGGKQYFLFNDHSASGTTVILAPEFIPGYRISQALKVPAARPFLRGERPLGSLFSQSVKSSQICNNHCASDTNSFCLSMMNRKHRNSQNRTFKN